MVPGKNAESRYIMSFDGGDYIGRLDRIHNLLAALWEEKFAVAMERPFNEYEFDLIGDTLYLLTDALFDTIRDMALQYGDDDFRGVKPYIEKAKQAEKAIECNNLVQQARRIQFHKTPQEEREEYGAKIDAISALPDDEAIPLLRAILKGGDKT